MSGPDALCSICQDRLNYPHELCEPLMCGHVYHSLCLGTYQQTQCLPQDQLRCPDCKHTAASLSSRLAEVGFAEVPPDTVVPGSPGHDPHAASSGGGAVVVSPTSPRTSLAAEAETSVTDGGDDYFPPGQPAIDDDEFPLVDPHAGHRLKPPLLGSCSRKQLCMFRRTPGQTWSCAGFGVCPSSSDVPCAPERIPGPLY